MGLFDKVKDMAAQAAEKATEAAMQKAEGMAAQRHEKTSNKVLDKMSGNGESMILRERTIEYKAKDKDLRGEFPLSGVSARVESGAELQSRVTVTRLVLTGIFAFALKKKKGGEKYVTIQGDEFFWAMEVDRKKANDAMKFVAKVNNQAAKN